MIIQCVIAAVFVSFSSKDDFTSIVYGDILFATVCSFALIVCEDIIATLMPFLLISAMSIKCYDSFDVFIKFVWFAPVLALAIIFHFVVYHKKFELGAIWKGTLFVGIAVTLGGLGKITVPEYFSGTALFYTTGLGLGMFAIYMLLNAMLTELLHLKDINQLARVEHIQLRKEQAISQLFLMRKRLNR